MARACCPMKIDASTDDAAPETGVINYPVSIYCVAVGQCSRASLGEPSNNYTVIECDELYDDTNRHSPREES